MPEAARRRSKYFLLLLIAVGAVSLLSMLVAPIEQLLPPGIDVPRIALLVQPAIIVAACCTLGWWATPKLGLDAQVLGALAEGGDWLGALRPMLVPALLGGLIGGILIALFGIAAQDFLNGRAQAIDLPLPVRVLYGGGVEEIVFRWTIMPLLALLLTRLRTSRGAALLVANLLAALLFAAGHVPNLLMEVDMPPWWMIPAVLMANSIVGLICGGLSIRRGFEAAMIAHGSAHLFSAPLLFLLA